MENIKESLKGLSNKEVLEKRAKFGKNKLEEVKKETFFVKIIHIMLEPMFVLLIGASIIYFVLGEPMDGIVMLVFVMAVITVEIIQEWKTTQTLNALKDLSAPQIEVKRDGKIMKILSEELVPGDVMLIEEGVKIPADGYVIESNDLQVNESSLTGEAEAIRKRNINDKFQSTDYWKKDYCYTGTLVTTGYGVILVDKIGNETEYGKIGLHLSKAQENIPPLEKQINKLVKYCLYIAIALFILVTFITFTTLSELSFINRVTQSILSGITLAMAMIPEEFPVVLTVFLSMGAWRLAQKQSLAKNLSVVETMGAISVLCVDKTGTITMNKMIMSEVKPFNTTKGELLTCLGLACEKEAYDPMEIAMLEFLEDNGIERSSLFSGKLITEYSFTDNLKMMGHVWLQNGKTHIVAKGSPESILKITTLTKDEKRQVESEVFELSKQGLRVIAVASKQLEIDEAIPAELLDCNLQFCGLVGLIDPPRAGVKENIKICNEAGIRVVMITGDNGVTAQAIAQNIGIIGTEHIVTGKQIDETSDKELGALMQKVNIFSRVTPEHKMRIVKALKASGEVVAMTGDGVNDAPAMKYADVGIAMGERGAEVSRDAADLVLLDDNFATIVTSIHDGRRIYHNIKKAVGYIFVIHIPIALIALLAPILSIPQEALFLLPLHVVLLELIIDPTCSIVFERQPAEQNIMNMPPRKINEPLLNKISLLKNTIQGLVIFGFSFGFYYYTLMSTNLNDELARTIGMSILFFSNIFLVQVNSSDIDSSFLAFRKLIHDKMIAIIFFIMIIVFVLLVYSPINQIFDLTALTFAQFLMTIVVSFVAVFWYDFVKYLKRKKLSSNA